MSAKHKNKKQFFWISLWYTSLKKNSWFFFLKKIQLHPCTLHVISLCTLELISTGHIGIGEFWAVATEWLVGFEPTLRAPSKFFVNYKNAIHIVGISVKSELTLRAPFWKHVFLLTSDELGQTMATARHSDCRRSKNNDQIKTSMTSLTFLFHENSNLSLSHDIFFNLRWKSGLLTYFDYMMHRLFLKMDNPILDFLLSFDLLLLIYWLYFVSFFFCVCAYSFLIIFDYDFLSLW